jgi:hypothetical protein
MRRELARRLRALQSRIAVPPYYEARARWLESGSWPSGRVRDAILSQEEILLEMQLRAPISAAKSRDLQAHLATVAAAKRGDAAAALSVLELARERERKRLPF